jgi:hypothetical protein
MWRKGRMEENHWEGQNPQWVVTPIKEEEECNVHQQFWCIIDHINHQPEKNNLAESSYKHS